MVSEAGRGQFARSMLPFQRITLLSSSVNQWTEALTFFVCVSSGIRANNVCT